jgi:glycine cleavage system aminomethyltransferase T
MEQGGELFDLLLEAGQPLGAVPVGLGVYLSTARLEKGYRAYGSELTPDYGLVEAGLHRRMVKKQEFTGKRAHLAERARTPAAVLCTLTVDYSAVAPDDRRYPLGGEVILGEGGEPIADARGRRSYVTSAGAGPSVGEYLLLAYVPPELAIAGQRLQVECMGERYPVAVAVAGNGAVFDPANERLRS